MTPFFTLPLCLEEIFPYLNCNKKIRNYRNYSEEILPTTWLRDAGGLNGKVCTLCICVPVSLHHDDGMARIW